MLPDITKNYSVILASQSPRRQQLLREIIPDFIIKSKEVEEIYNDQLKREEVVLYLAKLKSDAFGKLASNEMLITSDTIVCLEDEVLGKPHNEKVALEMLLKLSGKTHTVFTGVCVRTNAKTEIFFDATDVTFHEMTKDELKFYIHRCRPFDKAGSYGIQEWLGYVGIKKMEGEFYNVMGLPVHKLYQLLKTW